MTYYGGFLFSVIVNSVIWMVKSDIINEYYDKSTGFKDEKYLLQYALTRLILEEKRSKVTSYERQNCVKKKLSRTACSFYSSSTAEDEPLTFTLSLVTSSLT